MEETRLWPLVLEISAALPPSLWAAGIGFRERNHALTDELCLVFFAHAKLAADELHASERVPTTIAGIATDVRHARRVHHVRLATEKFDPLVGGAQMTVTGKAGYDGTLGGVFRDRSTGAPVAITNDHVVGFRFGIVAFFHGQHGVIDGFQPADVPSDDFGVVVKRMKEPDCAAIRLNASRAAPTTTSLRDARDDGELRIAGIAEPRVNDSVFKIGARTSYTEARITAATPTTVEIRPRNAPDEVISDHGDSGSLWCRRDGDEIVAVALHHSGSSSTPWIAYAAPMPRVAEALNIDVL